MKQLKYIKGNLLTIPEISIIGHQANTQNTMGSGVALSIKELYPDAYAADSRAAKLGANKLGAFSSATIERGGKPFTIYNLYGQSLYGRNKRQTNYEAIYAALEEMREDIDDIFIYENKTVGFPFQMSSCRAGADWNIIEVMIKVAFKDYLGEVIIVEYDGEKNA